MMETSVILLVVLGAIAGSGRGDGVLPDRLTAAAAGTTTFTTTLAPPERPFVVVAWSFAGNNIITSGDVDTTGATYAGRITLLRSTGSLELRNLTLGDGGKYTVTIIPDGAAALTGSCVLSVHEPVSGVVVTSHSLDLVESSSSVRLSCSSSGSSLSFLWLNSSSEVTASDRVHPTDGGSTLVISNVTRYDQGPFRCRVSNGVNSEISRPFSLNILYGPDQTIITAPPALHPGDFAVLHCSAPSAPPATILWTFEGEATEVSEAVLVLPRVSPSDGGTYGCTAVTMATGRHRSASHAVAVADVPECHCSDIVAVAIITTAGCCIFIVVTSVVLSFCLVRRRKRVNQTYATQLKDKGGVKRNQSDIYKISEAAQKHLYPFEVSNYSNYQKEAETSRKLQDFQSEKF